MDTDKHAASITGGSPGILHCAKTYVLQDSDGQILNAHSISAGLDYPGVGPEHAYWNDQRSVEYCSITDQEAIQAFYDLTLQEGIIPALESSHALAETKKRASRMDRSRIIVVNLSGRGDKDVDSILERKASE
jgi:tryptophan synthase beta chain